MHNVTVTFNGETMTNPMAGDSPEKAAFVAGAEIATLLVHKALGVPELANLLGEILMELDNAEVSVKA